MNYVRKWITQWIWPEPKIPYLVQATMEFDISQFVSKKVLLDTEKQIVWYRLELTQNEVEYLIKSNPAGLIAIEKSQRFHRPKF